MYFANFYQEIDQELDPDHLYLLLNSNNYARHLKK